MAKATKRRPAAKSASARSRTVPTAPKPAATAQAASGNGAPAATALPVIDYAADLRALERFVSSFSRGHQLVSLGDVSITRFLGWAHEFTRQKAQPAQLKSMAAGRPA